MNVLYDFDDGKYMANFLFGDTLCKVVMVKGDPGEPTDAQVRSAVYEYLEEHPNTFNPEGEYEDFTAGNANQLASNIYTEDTTPYIFRAVSDSSVEVGNREVIEQITGGTVAWNQLYKDEWWHQSQTTAYGLTLTPQGDGSTIINGTVSGKSSAGQRIYIAQSSIGTTFFHYIQGHKYLYLCPTLPSGVSGYTVLTGNTETTGYKQSNGPCVAEARQTADTYCFGGFEQIENGAVFSNFRYYLNVIDLTQMFGSTIADYIYSLETATAGAGVSLFKSLFPKDYYPYNAGELMSVKTSARETTGKNLLNVTSVTVEYRTFTVDSDGWITAENKTSDPRQWVYANCQWFVTLPKGAYSLDFWRNNIGASTSKAISVILNDGTVVVREYNFGESGSLNFSISNATTVGIMAKLYDFSARLQIRRSDAPTDYEPYQKHTYPLSNIELRGVTQLVNNKIQYDGDIYKADGGATRRYGIVVIDENSPIGQHAGGDTRFYIQKNDMKRRMNYLGYVICDRLQTVINYDNENENGFVSGYASATGYIGQNWLYFSNGVATTVADIKTWLASNPLTVVYELATPTTETANPYTEIQICSPYGTEEFIDDRAVAVPVGHYTKYPTDQVAKLDGLPSDFSTLIAPTESGTASRNYSVGSFLIMNNQLYKVTSAIASGAAITVGTNVTATTLAEQIIALLNR